MIILLVSYITCDYGSNYTVNQCVLGMKERLNSVFYAFALQMEIAQQGKAAYCLREQLWLNAGFDEQMADKNAL